MTSPTDLGPGLLTGVTVRPSGEAAVVLELGETIDEGVHDRVLALDDELGRAPPHGLREVLPTYHSLLLHLDPDVTTPEAVVAELRTRAALDARTRAGAEHDVRVSFAPADAEDLEEVASRTGLTPARVVELLTGTPLRLYCYGFVPGFAYLGGLPAELAVARRSTPREPVRAGAVMVAAGQAALCPSAMPTGWWVVGRTERSLFDADRRPPVPFEVGDRINLVGAGP